MAKLLVKLKMLKADVSYLREITRMERVDLMIIDDFGLQPLDNQSRLSFLEIIEDRHEQKSTIITSQIPVEKWYEIIGDKTVADYPNFFIMRSNITVYVVNHLLSCPNTADYFA